MAMWLTKRTWHRKLALISPSRQKRRLLGKIGASAISDIIDMVVFKIGSLVDIFLAPTYYDKCKTLGENSINPITEQCLLEVMSHPLGQGPPITILTNMWSSAIVCKIGPQEHARCQQFAPLDRCAVIALSKEILSVIFIPHYEI